MLLVRRENVLLLIFLMSALGALAVMRYYKSTVYLLTYVTRSALTPC